MLIGKYNNREQFWEDLDNLKAKGQVIMTDFKNAASYLSRYREHRRWNYYERNIDIVSHKTYDGTYVIVCLEDRK
jgi:hypothetical protein